MHLKSFTEGAFCMSFLYGGRCLGYGRQNPFGHLPMPVHGGIRSEMSEVVKNLLAITTSDYLLYGSDYLYQPEGVLTAGLERRRTWIKADTTFASYAERILYGNAHRLFNK